MSEDLKKELISKVLLEYNAFYSSMCRRPSERVVEFAGEIYKKGQIKNFFINGGLSCLSDEDCNILLRADSILDKAYANIATDCSLSADKIYLALNSITEKVKHDLLPDQTYLVELDVNGFIHNPDYVGNVQIIEMIAANYKDYERLHAYIPEIPTVSGNDINDRLYLIRGKVKQIVTAKTAGEAYGKGMDSVNLGNILMPRISGGGVELVSMPLPKE